MSNKKEKEAKNTSTEGKDTVWDSFWKLAKPVEVNKEDKPVKWF
ncbi:hypothetical protein QTG56_15370 [Rossellomorea sp. AcN35-11]|nr:hypothetical protein QTG56_15370 [Rossellomorea sp. AcN35-11]